MGNQQVKSDLDIQKYSGEWVEYARLPNIFQNGCSKSRANYTIVADSNELIVENQCFDKNNNLIKSVRGTARSIQPGKLKVVFDQTKWMDTKLTKNIPNYYILNTDYTRYAVVGSPDRLMAWVLIRPDVIKDAELLQNIKTTSILTLKNNGYLTTPLLTWNY